MRFCGVVSLYLMVTHRFFDPLARWGARLIPVLALVTILASCQLGQPPDPPAQPASQITLSASSTANNSCTIYGGRLAFESHPAQGYDVAFLIDSYNGPGEYSDIVTDLDSQGGTKFTIHSIGGSKPSVLRGVGERGSIRVVTVNADRIAGSLRVSVFDAGGTPTVKRLNVVGNWSCLRAEPGSPPRSFVVPTPPVPSAQ